MKSIILAAGKGSRLGEITKTIPKGLVDINGKSILERQISSFKRNDINDIVLVIGNFSDKYRFNDVTYLNGKESFEHNILFSLIEAKEEFNDDVIIAYGDIIFDDEIIKKLNKTKYDICLAVDMNWKDRYKKKSKFLVDHICNVIIENNKIKNIGYRKNLNFQSDKMVGEFIGLMKFKKNSMKEFLRIYFEILENHKGKFHESPSIIEGIITDMIQEIIERNFEVNYVTIDSKWCEIDTPEDLYEARKIFSV